MSEIGQLIKQLARDQYNASQPTAVELGTVTSVSPLKIKLDEKRTIYGSFIKRTDTFKNKTLKTGDRVFIIRQAGGENFYCIDTIGSKGDGDS